VVAAADTGAGVTGVGAGIWAVASEA